jgi:CRISPR-associated protein Csm1
MDDLKLALRDYGEWMMAKQLGMENLRASPAEDSSIQKARGILKEILINESDQHLTSIFSLVSDKLTNAFPLKILSHELDIKEDQTKSQIWHDFERESSLIPKTPTSFDTFYNVYKKYAWYVPSSLEMREISLFEHFKAIIALSHCIQKGENLLLVGGDLPGIQNMVYTITSKGAAKSLKGRSFYIQMLCDIMLQAVLRELDLPSANVIYSAGGNFKLIASNNDVEKLNKLRKEINDRLLDGHKGELFATIDWVDMDIKDVVSKDAFKSKMDCLAEKLGISKRKWFSEQVKSERYDDIFGVRGNGGPTSASDSEGEKNFCEVCHVEVDENSRIVKEEDEPTKCYQCDSFEKLTKDMLDSKCMVIESLSNYLPPKKKEYTKLGKPSWDDVIESLGYRIKWDNLSQGNSLSICKLNSTDFLPKEPNPNLTYNFKFIGNVTPKMDRADVEYIKKHDEDDHSGLGDIQNTTVMAERHATGIPRSAVLRMDIDGLGDIFRQPKNMLQTSALSSALSLFFDGWLNCICHDISKKWQSELKEKLKIDIQSEEFKLPYIIYSGGDDLFIVGTWDVIPMLAERIRNDFASYVSKGYVSDEKVIDPCMTISAGITLCHSKFPIYQAADMAKEALDERAKNRDSNGKKKDAIDFLGITVGWEEFDEIKKLAFELANLIEVNKVPHALLTLLKTVADSYQEDLEKCQSSSGIVYGKWMWQLAYGLSRMVERTKPTELKERIMKVGGNAVDLGKAKQWRMIRHLNLPVRWAEYLIVSVA